MNTHITINNIYHPPAPDYDPLNLPRGTVSETRFSYDAVHPDALEVIEKLLAVKTDGDLKKLCWELFREYFSDEIAETCGESEYENALFDVWKTCCR